MTNENTLLHAAIMNLPANRANSYRTTAERFAYAAGHRDARHAAAELALASSSIKEDGDQAIYNSMAARYQRDRLKEDGERAEPVAMSLDRKKRIAHHIVGDDPQSEVTALRIINAVLYDLSSPPSPLGDTPEGGA